MGGVYNFYLLQETDREKAIQAFHNHVARSQYESGHSYSGEIGMKTEIVDGPTDFATEDEASDWVSEHNEKWGPAHLVRLKDGRYGYGGWCSS